LSTDTAQLEYLQAGSNPVPDAEVNNIRSKQFSVLSSIKSDNPLNQLQELERNKAFIQMSKNPYSIGV